MTEGKQDAEYLPSDSEAEAAGEKAADQADSDLEDAGVASSDKGNAEADESDED